MCSPRPQGFGAPRTLESIEERIRGIADVRVVCPVHRAEQVPVELQIRTIAMHLCAGVEHSIYYKYDGAVPPTLLDELGTAARTAADLDATMARLRTEVRTLQD